MQTKPEQYNFEYHFQFLIAQSIFARISSDSTAFYRFVKDITFTKFFKGEVIYTEGDPSHTIYLVRDGEIHLTRNSNQGTLSIIGKHGRGSMFGEVSFLNKDNHTTTAVADLDSRVYCIPGKAMMKLMESEYSIGPAMAKLISWRLHRAMKNEYVNEFPARIHTIFYPEDARRCGDICNVLAASLVDENPGPVLLLGLGSTCAWHKDHHPLMSDILNRWPDVQLGEILLKTEQRPGDFDILIGCEIHDKQFNATEAARIIPALLGRLKKYYASILVDAGRHFSNPVITKVLSQSDKVVLVQNPDISSRHSRRWTALIDHCKKHVNNFNQKIITVSDIQSEKPAGIMSEWKQVNPFSSMYQNHFYLPSKSPDLKKSIEERSFRTGMHRLARALSGTSRGICFGGGGARAFAHLGVIDVLEREGIDFDIVVGTSMGAIIGAAYARGLDSHQIKETVRKILPNAQAIFDKNLPLVSFYRGHKLSRAIKQAFGDLRFEDLEIPFICNGCDLDTGHHLIFENGFLSPALRGSTSLPGVFPPYKYGKYRIIDGGIVNNLPGEILRQRNYSRIFGVNVSPLYDHAAASTSIDERKGDFFQKIKDYFSIPPILKIINRSISIQSIELLKLRIDDFDYIIHPNISKFDLFDFDLIDEIIEAGRITAQENLPAIKQSLIRPQMSN